MSVRVQHARQSWLHDIVCACDCSHCVLLVLCLLVPGMSLSFPAVLFISSGTSVCSIAGESLLVRVCSADDLQTCRFV